MDINLILDGGWPPSELNNMPYSEFLTWYNLAIETHEAREKARAEANR